MQRNRPDAAPGSLRSGGFFSERRTPIRHAGMRLASPHFRLVLQSEPYASSYLNQNPEIFLLATMRTTPAPAWTPAPMIAASDSAKKNPTTKAGIVYRQTNSPRTLIKTFANCLDFMTQAWPCHSENQDKSPAISSIHFRHDFAPFSVTFNPCSNRPICLT